MIDPYLLCAFILLLSVSIGMFRIFSLLFSGKGPVEQLLVLQLLGTSLVAVILLLTQSQNLPGLRDLALVLGLLACIVAIAFVQYSGFDHNTPEQNSKWKNTAVENVKESNLVLKNNISKKNVVKNNDQ